MFFLFFIAPPPGFHDGSSGSKLKPDMGVADPDAPGGISNKLKPDMGVADPDAPGGTSSNPKLGVEDDDDT